MAGYKSYSHFNEGMFKAKFDYSKINKRQKWILN